MTEITINVSDKVLLHAAALAKEWGWTMEEVLAHAADKGLLLIDVKSADSLLQNLDRVFMETLDKLKKNPDVVSKIMDMIQEDEQRRTKEWVKDRVKKE